MWGASRRTDAPSFLASVDSSDEKEVGAAGVVQDATASFAPWLFAIARNKLIDALRRRGRRIFVDIDDFAETLPGETPAETASASEVAAQLETLPARQREVLQSIAVDSASIKDTAAKFSMSEGAVRVALHRGLASLTAKLREQ